MSGSNLPQIPADAEGISVVICTHNGSARLKEVIDSLLRQVTPPELKFEIIVVDNASDDESSKLAHQILSAQSAVPYRIVFESKLGLMFARIKGIEASAHDIVAFVDDDNRVQSDWLHQAHIIMNSHPDVGVCGGWNEPVFETKPPAWFHRFQSSFGTGPQEGMGPPFVFGAGMILRKAAWNDVNHTFHGYFPKSRGRQGNTLSLGEDNEICYAIRSLGWKIRYDPKLRILHSLSEHRLNTDYLFEVQKRYGTTTVLLDPYLLAPDSAISFFSSMKRTWIWQFTLTFGKLIVFLFLFGLLAVLPFFPEARLECRLRIVRHSHRLRALIHLRSEYIQNIREVRRRLKQHRP